MLLERSIDRDCDFFFAGGLLLRRLCRGGVPCVANTFTHDFYFLFFRAWERHCKMTFSLPCAPLVLGHRNVSLVTPKEAQLRDFQGTEKLTSKS